MYVRVCIYICMYACMRVCNMYVCIICMNVCNVCIYVRNVMYVCMYVCFFPALTFSHVDRGIVMGRQSVQGVFPNVYERDSDIRNNGRL
jgi:hypothetical protein